MGKEIETEDLVYDINEWDDYAIEEAVLIKEKLGGTITAITVGSEEADNTLRKCLAKGADQAIRLSDEAFEGSDAFAIAKILSKAIESMSFDLIFTGTQASDDGYGQVGVILASLLGISHATLVKKIEVKKGSVVVNRELEGGLEQVLDVKLPTVIAVQTGINEPRYVSIMAIRRARKIPIKVMGISRYRSRRRRSWKNWILAKHRRDVFASCRERSRISNRNSRRNCYKDYSNLQRQGDCVDDRNSCIS